MAYLPTKIKAVVEDMNHKYFLPHIQRELVWTQDQIVKLFDSLMRGYPISTFLFWKIAGKRDITKLEFTKYYKKGITKNEINTDVDKDEFWLVLDGQQRLQSFYIALKGSYNDSELFFNALSKKPITDDESEDEGNEESEIIYETTFLKSKEGYFIRDITDRRTGERLKKLWVKIKDFAMLEGEDQDGIRKITKYTNEIRDKYKNQITVAESDLIEDNIKRMNNLVTQTDTIFYYLEDENEYDKEGNRGRCLTLDKNL